MGATRANPISAGAPKDTVYPSVALILDPGKCEQRSSAG